ncbi:MAG: ArsR/SmtB family transcription factor [Planctomycetota bacterium]
MEEYRIQTLPFDPVLVSDLLRTMAHPMRLRMLQLLMLNRYNVGELAKVCKIQNHMASEHLRLMQRSGLLSSQREGRKIYYTVTNSGVIELLRCIAGYGIKAETTFEHGTIPGQD